MASLTVINGGGKKPIQQERLSDALWRAAHAAVRAAEAYELVEKLGGCCETPGCENENRRLRHAWVFLQEAIWTMNAAEALEERLSAERDDAPSEAS